MFKKNGLGKLIKSKRYVYTDGKKVLCENGLFILKPFLEECVLFTYHEVITDWELNSENCYFTASKYSLLRK